MRRTRVLWEYVTCFEEALDRYKQGRLTAEEAGELLGLSGRHFRRQCARYEAEGVDGLRDKRLGRRSPRRAPESELERIRRLHREEFADFTVKHFHEEIRRQHGYRLGYTVTRLALQSAGLVKPAPRRGKHRKKRPRRPMPGMLLFQDASTHRWIGALGHDLDLVVTLDDATRCIYSAILVEQEGTLSSFLGLQALGTSLFLDLGIQIGGHFPGALFCKPRTDSRAGMARHVADQRHLAGDCRREYDVHFTEHRIHLLHHPASETIELDVVDS